MLAGDAPGGHGPLPGLATPDPWPLKRPWVKVGGGSVIIWPMAKMIGGMEFRHGSLVRLPPLPGKVSAQPIRITFPCQPSQSIGQRIEAGEVLYDNGESSSSCLVSPIAGKISAMVRWDHSPTLSGDRHDLIITPDQEMVATRLAKSLPRGRTIESWHTQLRRLGRWSGANETFDLVAQMAMAKRSGAAAVDTVICIGLDGFPPYPDRSSLLDSFPDDAVLGVQILADVFNAKKVLMLASAGNAAAGRLRRACRNFRVPLATAVNVYPRSHPTLVAVAHATGKRKLPHGANPAAHGLVMVEPWTAIRIARWFTQDELDLVRPMMIGWPSASESLTPIYAMPGQALSTLHGALAGSSMSMAGRVVRGNPMTGRAFLAPELRSREHTPVVPPDDLLISVLSSAPAPMREACVSCGWCMEVCPTGLRPIRLAEKIEAGRMTTRVETNLSFCIECELCTHVCPSGIPVARILKQAKPDAKHNSPNLDSAGDMASTNPDRS